MPLRVQQSLGGADLAYVDGALPPEEIARRSLQCCAARRKPPFSILLATSAAAIAFATDAVAGKPSRLEEAQLAARALDAGAAAEPRAGGRRTRRPCAAIVRKALVATRFPFDVTEADEGLTALKLMREAEFDLVFLDYNMPDFSGLETLAEIKREQRRVSVVMMTSTQDEALAKRARELGAAFLKKPFFPGDVETVLCGYYGLRALHPNRV